jgi:hypothetical protein
MRLSARIELAVIGCVFGTIGDEFLYVAILLFRQFRLTENQFDLPILADFSA